MNLLFNLPPPNPALLGSPISFFGTYYYDYLAQELAGAGGIAITDLNGRTVGPQISQRDWCLGACEGTLAVRKLDGSLLTFNFEGLSPTATTSCGAFFGSLSSSQVAALGRTRFDIARGPYGDGAPPYSLVPFRTVAVDANVISIGTSLFIPDAAGCALTLPNGNNAVHDGYFFAADTGGAIIGNHLDFFLGITQANPFPFVTSSDSNVFDVEVVSDLGVSAFLKTLHLQRA